MLATSHLVAFYTAAHLFCLQAHVRLMIIKCLFQACLYKGFVELACEVGCRHVI